MTINITSYPLTSIEPEVFAQKWQTLESEADAHFFLSWQWISVWINTHGLPITVIEAQIEQKTLGLSLWVEKTRYILGFYPIKQAWLHRTGEPKKDQMWIEYNDILLAQSHQNEVRSAMLEYIKQGHLGWQEFIIGLSDADTIEEYQAHFPTGYTAIASQGYKVDLDALTRPYKQAVLSRNTRSQINRSYKLLQLQGEVSFKVLTDHEEILACWPHVAKLHKTRWQDSPEGSGFNNRYFEDFHRELLNLVAKSEKSDAIQLGVLLLNNEPIGYLVNYLYANKVYFYLSALETGFAGKIKLGMLLHTLAIEHYQALNIAQYDFLAGDARYKQSLSDKIYMQKLEHFFVKGLMLSIEHKLRLLKQKFA